VRWTRAPAGARLHHQIAHCIVIRCIIHDKHLSSLIRKSVMIFGSISSIKIKHRWENKPSSLTGKWLGHIFGFQQVLHPAPFRYLRWGIAPICFPVDAGAMFIIVNFNFLLLLFFCFFFTQKLLLPSNCFLFCIVTISADLLLSVCKFSCPFFFIHHPPKKGRAPLVARATPAIIIHIMAPDLNDRIICIEWRCYNSYYILSCFFFSLSGS